MMFEEAYMEILHGCGTRELFFDYSCQYLFRIGQDTPVLVMISMLAYFFFLEQLLVAEMGSHALAISLPFSCVLGLLSSMIASTMVSKSYIWLYASFQFATIILFAHIFYNAVKAESRSCAFYPTFITHSVRDCNKYKFSTCGVLEMEN